ncbi:NAD-dependent dehydratase [Arenicella chitinivorans]|uniref:NAD-dependent dehydratase n=1 Tax=Arenicella chitinivorans TaxID=1329800 RepID=A0A918S163_9GAMM|nr:SDR family oxidoreductase [Arenicella chitinivorans]GHA18697.1 NAD-dependent dehydratase [Arenicella chitinivorans]
MKVLVTGHLGYIGGVLVPMLNAAGHEVDGCDMNFFADCVYVPEASFHGHNLAKDVRDLTVQDLEGYEAVIHLAGLSNDPLGNFDPTLTIEINQSASVRLAGLAKQAGVRRFLFASSCSNYGASAGELLDEHAPFNPQTAYGHSKVGAETAVCELACASFEPCNLRAGTVYGVAPRIRFDLVVNNLVAYALASKQVVLKSDGRAWRPLVHVSDVARAYVATLEAPSARVAGQAFNVGRTAENYQILEVARLVHAAVPGSELRTLDEAFADTRNYRVNCDKLVQTVPAYRPVWDLAAGIQELVDVITRVPVAVEDFEGNRFNRLAHLKSLISNGVIDCALRATGR